MRAHQALWKFAETSGSVYAARHAQNRQSLPVSERSDSDTRWLCSRGGLALRRAWLALPESTRVELMRDNPDPAFGFSTSGVNDERRANRSTGPRSKQKVKHKRGVKVSGTASSSTTDYAVLDSNTSDRTMHIFRAARVHYHEVVMEEELIRIQIAYNKGSFLGVLESILRNAERAVHLAKYKDSSTTPAEAIEAAASRLVDVFAVVRGTTMDSPDPSCEGPSEAFALSRINQAYNQYCAAASTLSATERDECGHDVPLLPNGYPWFRRVQPPAATFN
ncbi:hypothetical protein PHYPSEUDO_013237 [Phytophthora pseudosyringae]|uniref:Uncharacterized protein n=1 Tax=Phytophthora pseudosyringae TaxID=221518 RepID=A0A8T1W3L7_9STRA|nr:hypothetical protein PHYPSEUDO_013237 [Phytophthora pseudosyringae]